MATPRRLALALALALLALTPACGGGTLDTGDAYRKAMKQVESQLSQVASAARDAEMTGDPMMLGRAFEGLLPKMAALRQAVAAPKVGGPVQPVHEAFRGAVDAYVGAYEGLGATITSTVLKDSKEAMRGANKRFEEALAAWREAKAAL